MASGTIDGYCTNDRSTQPEFHCDWSSTPINNTQSSLTLNWRVYAPNSWYPYSYETNNFTYTLTLPNDSTYTDSIPSHRIHFNTSSGSDWKYYLKDTHPANTTEAGYDWCGNYTGKQGYTFYSETFTITHKSDGTASVGIYTYLHPNAGTLREGFIREGTSGTKPIYITLDNLVSACTAPTSVSVSSAIIAPGSVTVSWSGASAGNNNAISKYRLFYKTGSAPTISSYTGYFDTTSTSYAPNILTSRGTTYYFKVQTIGSVSGYDSGISSVQATCLVNTAPNAPTITDSNRTITSSAASVSVTVTAGASNGGGTGRIVYYNTSNSHSGQSQLTLNSSYQGTLTFNPSQGNSTTYYCWTWDGYEYSDVSSRTITRNLKPTITAYTFTPNGYLAQGTAASTNTYVSSVSAVATCNKVCTVKIQLLYGTSTSPSTAINCADQSGKTSSSSIGSYNINNLLKNYYDGGRLYFRLRIRVADSYETNEDWSYSNVWSIAAAPSATATYDQFSDSNIISGKFWKKIRIKFLEDSSMATRTVTACNNSATSTTYAITTTTSTSGNYRYLDVTFTGAVSDGVTVRLTVTLTDGNISKTFTTTRQKISTPSIGSSVTVITAINMYDLASTIQFQCGAGGVSFNNNQIVTETPYYLTKVEAYVAKDNQDTNSRPVTLSTAQKSNDNAVFTATALNNFVQFGDWGKSTYSGTSTGYVKVVFTNKYSESFTAGYSSFSINYNRAPVCNSFTLQYRTSSTGSWTDLATVNSTTSGNITATKALQEGLYLRAKINYTIYSASDLTIKLRKKINSSGTFTDVNSTTITAANRTSGLTTDVYINYGSPTLISEITDDYDRYWQVYFNNAAYNHQIITHVLKHFAPSVTLTSVTGAPSPATGTRTGATITYSYNNKVDNISTLSGVSVTKTIQLCDSNHTVINSDNLYSSASGTKSDSSSDKKQWIQKTIGLKFVTTINANTVAPISTTKTYYSNLIIVQLEGPTVAYRKHQLGINTAAVSNDTVLDIYTNTASNRQYIRLHGTTNVIEIDLLNNIIDII